jgi:hypothetical protein
VILQHCDTFWLESSPTWYQLACNAIDDKCLLIQKEHKRSQFLLDGRRASYISDHAVIYNRQKFLDAKLEFTWGYLKDLNPSDDVRAAIQSGRMVFNDISRSKPFNTSKRIDLQDDWLDGSELITMEVAVRFPELRKDIDWSFTHVSHFFRIAEDLYINNGFVRIDRKFGNHIEHLALYAYCCSFVFDKCDIPVNKIFPWGTFIKICQAAGFNLEHARGYQEFFEHLPQIKKYSVAQEIVGMDEMGIHTVVFKDKKYTKVDGIYQESMIITKIL